MRFCEDLNIKKVVIHVMDQNGDEPVMGDSLVELDSDSYEYLYNHILKVLSSDNNNRGEFLNENGIVYNSVKEMILNDDFLEGSRKIGEFLFKVLKSVKGSLSGDLVILELSIDGETVIGILFLEYKTSFVHDIRFREDSLAVDIKAQTIALPPVGQRLSRCAFIKMPSIDSIELIMLERPNLDEDGERVEYFVEKFIQGTIVLDNYDITRIFKEQSERWVRKNLKSDINKATEIRSEIDDKYINSVDVDIEDVANQITDSLDEKEKFLMELEKKGIDVNDQFEIDKRFVQKKYKQKNIKTDTGFSIRGEFDFFSDSSRFEMKVNGDGTVNYIIKGVRNVREL